MSEPTTGARWYRQFWPWFLLGILAFGIATSTITAIVALSVHDAPVRVEAPALDKTSWRER